VSETVTHDIPVDRYEYDWNQDEKLRMNQLRFIKRFDPLLAQVMNLLIAAGFIASLWQIWAIPTIFTIGMGMLYAGLLILRFTRGKPVLYGVITLGGAPLQYAAVHIMRDGARVASKITDEYGRYMAILIPHSYTIQVDARQAEDVYTTVHTRHLVSKDGVINISIDL
jgi:hypothetical protein